MSDGISHVVTYGVISATHVSGDDEFVLGWRKLLPKGGSIGSWLKLTTPAQWQIVPIVAVGIDNLI